MSFRRTACDVPANLAGLPRSRYTDLTVGLAPSDGAIVRVVATLLRVGLFIFLL